MEVLALLAALCTAPNFCEVHYNKSVDRGRLFAGYVIELRSYKGPRGTLRGTSRCFKIEGGQYVRLVPISCKWAQRRRRPAVLSP